MPLLKHTLHKEIRQSVSPEVISYKDFMNRIFCTKDINKRNDPDHIRKLASTKLIKKDCKSDQYGRECTICKEYKKQDQYYNGYGICKICYNKHYNNRKPAPVIEDREFEGLRM